MHRHIFANKPTSQLSSIANISLSLARSGCSQGCHSHICDRDKKRSVGKSILLVQATQEFADRRGLMASQIRSATNRGKGTPPHQVSRGRSTPNTEKRGNAYFYISKSSQKLPRATL